MQCYEVSTDRRKVSDYPHGTTSACLKALLFSLLGSEP